MPRFLDGGCMIIGTDTGVGKTVITAALARHLKDLGLRVAVMKPIETGYANEQGVGSDAERLRSAIRATTSMDVISPYRFALPLAPWAAARAAGVTIEADRIVGAFRRLADAHDAVLVEGVGGLLVPLSEKTDLRDLIVSLGVPALLVGRPALGGVNHALLTLEALRQHAIPIVGIVLNQLVPNPNYEQTQSTIELIRVRSGVPVFGPTPYDEACRSDWMAGVARIAADPAIHSLAERLVQWPRPTR